jgi:hypothetical protein
MLLPGLNEAMGSGLTLSVLEWGRAALGNSFTVQMEKYTVQMEK